MEDEFYGGAITSYNLNWSYTISQTIIRFYGFITGRHFYLCCRFFPGMFYYLVEFNMEKKFDIHELC